MEKYDFVEFGKDFKTRIYSTRPSLGGVKVRVDERPCYMRLVNGSVCTLKKKIVYIKYRDTSGSVQKNAVLICDHQLDELPEDEVHFTEEIIVDLVDRINEGQSFSTIYEKQKSIFPTVQFKNRSVPETRPGKGKWKEFRCSQKSKYWKFKHTDVTLDVWEKDSSGKHISRVDANKSIVWRKNDYPKNKNNNWNTSHYDSTPCACGHDIGAHTRGKCPVCKKFC